MLEIEDEIRGIEEYFREDMGNTVLADAISAAVRRMHGLESTPNDFNELLKSLNKHLTEMNVETKHSYSLMEAYFKEIRSSIFLERKIGIKIKFGFGNRPKKERFMIRM